MVVRRHRLVLLKGVFIFISACILSTYKPALYSYSTKQVKVLIVAYMRSGSTLIGDILQYSEEPFYVYEPLRSICPSDCSSVDSSNLIYANGRNGWMPAPFHKEAYSTLQKWFSCNISQLPTTEFFDVFLGKSWNSKSLFSCYRETILETMDHAYARRKCVQNLVNMCDKSPIRVIKTVRANLRTAKYLLNDFPDLKIIHVIRDPRATLSSQSHIGMCPVGDYGRYKCSNRLCNRLENDINEYGRLSETYPNRIMTLRYEDLARFPLETSQKMYDFIGVEMTPETREFVYNKTMAGRRRDCTVCLTGSNSSLHVDKWRHRMDKDFISIVNKTCSSVIKRLNYDDLSIRYK